MPRPPKHIPEQLDTKSLECNAFKHPVSADVKALKELGDIGVTIKFDRDTGRPVLWIWQTFTVIRVDIFQALTLAARIMEVVYAHLRNPKKPKDQSDDDDD